MYRKEKVMQKTNKNEINELAESLVNKKRQQIRDEAPYIKNKIDLAVMMLIKFDYKYGLISKELCDAAIDIVKQKKGNE